MQIHLENEEGIYCDVIIKIPQHAKNAIKRNGDVFLDDLNAPTSIFSHRIPLWLTRFFYRFRMYSPTINLDVSFEMCQFD